MKSFSVTVAMAAFVALTFAGCGGGKSSSTSTTTQATAAPMSETQRETAALPSGAMKPVPAGLHCGGTKPVWVNLKSKAYHEAGDPYYGRTHNGEYMCLSDAEAKGYHAAGAAHHHKHRKGGGAMNESAPDTEPT